MKDIKKILAIVIIVSSLATWGGADAKWWLFLIGALIGVLLIFVLIDSDEG